jgi:ABC-type taurine transport system ATPase subunit
VTLLDQPFAALDVASVRIIQEVLREASDHPSRAWLVADYEAPANLSATRVLRLT